MICHHSSAAADGALSLNICNYSGMTVDWMKMQFLLSLSLSLVRIWPAGVDRRGRHSHSVFCVSRGDWVHGTRVTHLHGKRNCPEMFSTMSSSSCLASESSRIQLNCPRMRQQLQHNKNHSEYVSVVVDVVALGCSNWALICMISRHWQSAVDRWIE